MLSFKKIKNLKKYKDKKYLKIYFFSKNVVFSKT